MSETKATTPRPWKLVPGGDECCIYIEECGRKGRGGIATVFTDRETPSAAETADAELIVTAVNAFDDLVVALKSVLPEMQREHDAGDGHFSSAQVDAVRSAIAKSEAV